MDPKRILLCDDDLHILRAAEFKFKRAGFEVFCAGDGEDAWRLILEVRPDMVITDCQMPRLGGLELALRIKTEPALAGLPVLMLTAKGFELDQADICEKFGILAVLAKPFSPRELLKMVENVLQDRAQEQCCYEATD